MGTRPYRTLPVARPQMRRQHHPTCMWCVWRSPCGHELVCKNPINNPANGMPYVNRFNSEGQCAEYEPDTLTEILQAVGLRRWIERQNAPEET